MAGTREIKGRIKSVKNIQQITKAMKMVAAARIKKVETRMKASRPYAYKMQEVVGELTSQLAGIAHPLMQTRAVKRIALLVVSSDKGLCGSYNSNVMRLAQGFIARQPEGRQVNLFCVGGKGSRFFHRRKLAIPGEWLNWSPDIGLARALAVRVTELFTSGEADEVHVVYTRMKSAMTQEAVVEKILPVKAPTEAAKPLPYIFEPDPAKALDTILPRYLEIILFQILLEGRTAELASRLRAMSNATDNASKLVSELTLDYFRARQADITNQILEIASGAEALAK